MGFRVNWYTRSYTGSKDENKQLAAVKALGSLHDPAAIPTLVLALGNKSDEVVKCAAESLGNLGPCALDPILAALDNGNGRAALALGKLGECAVEPLLAELANPKSRVRGSIASALGELGDIRAIEPLARAMHEEAKGASEHNVHIAATKALGKIRSPRAADILIAEVDSPAGGSLGASGMREHAARALGDQGDARAIEALIRALGTGGAGGRWVRSAAAESLGKLGDARALDPLLDLLVDDQDGPRRSAAAALAHLGLGQWCEWVRGDKGDLERLTQAKDLRLAGALLRALVSRAPATRQAAAAALRELGQPEWSQMVQGSEGDLVRLGKSGDKRLIEPLIARLDDGQAEAAAALAEIGDVRAVGPLLRALESGPKEAAAAALESRFAEEEGVGAVLRRYRENEAQQTAAAAEKARREAEKAAEDERVRSEIRSLSLEDLIHNLQHGNAPQAGYELARRAEAQGDPVITALLTAVGDQGMLARYRQLKRSGQWRNSDAGMLIVELTRLAITRRS
jgi:HEAT repeat protein